MSTEELELLRKKAKNVVIYGILISITLTIILFIIFDMSFFSFFFLFFGIVITFIASIKPAKKFNLAFKNTFVLKSLQLVFSDLTYYPERGIDEAVIRNTKMMYMGDRYSSNDYVSGKYKNISVVQSDVHIEERHESTDSDGNTTTTWVTIFKGRWMIFEFNKNFKANVQVSQRKFGNSRISNWGSTLKYKKVMMEDQEFNKLFRVYAQDEHDAFYILTPSLIEKIKKIANDVSGQLLFCFIDNNLHVGIYNNRDSFEHSIFTKIDVEKINNKIANDIKLITDFIDELNLENDLFKR